MGKENITRAHHQINEVIQQNADQSGDSFSQLEVYIEKLGQQIMFVWGSRCVPAYLKDEVEKEVRRLWLYDFKGQYGRYTKELASVFGYFDLDSYTRKNSVYIENEVFEKLSTLKDTSFKIYLRLRLEKHLIQENKKEKEHIAKLSVIIEIAL